MNKYVKITLIAVVSLILIIFIGLVILVSVVDPNKYKDDISKAVKDSTGRDLVIAGKIEWRLFPWLGLKVQDVTLGNAKGFGPEPFLKFQEADASIKLLPLLSSRVEVSNVGLVNAEINLAKNSAGVSNWDDLVKSAQSKQSSTPTAAAPSHLSLFIQNISITDSKLTWNDKQNKKLMTLSNINFKAKNISLGSPFNVSLSADMRDEIKKVNSTLSFSTKITLSRDLNSINIENLVTKINNFQFNGTFSVKNVNQNAEFEGKFDIPTFNLRELASNVGTTLPPMKNPNALKAVSLSSEFSGTKNSLDVKSLKLKLDSTNINGNAQINNFNAPSIRFTVQADQLNADDYLPPPTGNAASTSGAAGNQPADFSALRTMDVQGKMSVAKFVITNLTTTDASLVVNAKNGILQIQNMQAKLYQGTTVTNLSVDVRTNTPKISAQSKFSKVQMQPLLKDFMNSSAFSAVADMTINITSSGADSAAIKRNLNGNMSLAMKNGIINGINIEDLIAKASAAFNKLAAPAGSGNNTTSFGTVTATGRIANGILYNNDLLIDAPRFTGKGAGSIDLTRDYIDYILKIRALNLGILGNYDIPITIKGSFAEPNKPSVGLDIGSLLAQVAVQQVTQEVNKQIQQQGQKLLGGLFGGGQQPVTTQ